MSAKRFRKALLERNRLSFFDDPRGSVQLSLPSGRMWPVGIAFGVMFVPLWPALLALVLSHGISFYENFLKGEEHVGRTVGEQMGEPYKRVIVLHVTIIFGGWAILLLGSPLPALVLLLVLKTWVDLAAHRKEHAEARAT
ncbi:MAG: hypothetical protein EXR92_07730 [Gemmatimonadetes bacterium]|nr:hypothetical protein [Gemmatimonadota bacterium]